MYTLNINGQVVTTDKKQSLLRFLRDELHLTSVKDGCSQGACGACTVIIDGETCKACVPSTDQLEGKKIITTEGLTEWESKVYTYAYGEAGAVQCGFCIPGMVMCTKALLDKNPDPTEDEIKYALRNNYCRCTGYVKIIAAVKLAAKIKRAGEIPEKGADDWKIGSRVHRLDVEEKVLGYGKYPDDYYLENMCYGSALRSKYPRARVLSIDTSIAKALPGVIGVFTADDIPGENKIGHLKHDQYTLVPVGGLTHYLGDGIALVAAEDMETAEQAKRLIKVAYEILPAVHNIEEAAAEGAPLVFDEETTNVQAHKHVSRGNAEEAIKHSAHVITEHFETPWTEHAFLEPECAVAYMDADDYVHIISTDQSAYCTYHECSLMLGTDKVRAENALVGGGFGGKEDMTVQPYAALITYLTGRPAKARLTREESLLVHPKRHHFVMDFTMGCDEQGIIQGVKAKVASDTGAFASLGGPVLERACTHAAGPYAYENFEIEGDAYYTNNPPAGAFRGFGVTQTCFATETLLNMMAEKIGISPWEIRYRNAIRPGGVLPNGQIVDDSTGLVETLEAVKEAYDAAVAAGKPVGIACAMKNAGVGVGIPDTGRVRLIVEDDEKLHIYSGASCIGQGLGTVLVQMVVTNTDLKRDDIVYERSNTWIAPDSGTTSGSRQTLVTGEACRRACDMFMEAKKGGKSLKDLKGQEFYAEYLAKTDPLGANVPNPVSHVAYGYATQMCILDPKTGKIEKMIAAHDVGKAVNPLSCEGQIEGGVVMSMGFALRERYPIDENCRPISKYGALGLFRAHEIPEIEPIVIDKPGLKVACGAIGIGEITSIPTAPAITDAYYHWDGERRFSLPISDTPYERKK
ncbi:selenium-dependent xanthine dehydrogenase [Frisingicoccus sp.]|uniref:selenium-dependent xanthine dehydrogenase n=1 Tax=Frisingicoccus sp. TaxID=1918627 RepID=UPI002A7F7070|nr:selenium-dependent xanthine dehydrogenase [Frisingicoccus sp.]MDY4922764.1 selenium-dependent xanthine dehydrogenase [Frisingicoccus sp.]